MFSKYFDIYSETRAPFLHKMHKEWEQQRPLAGLSVLNHTPVLPNTLLKIAYLVVAGAKVIVSNPSFMRAHADAVQALRDTGICYVEDLSELKQEVFDLYFDCSAEAYQALGAPRIGAIELTATGDHYYCAQSLTFPVVSIDRTLTKQLETVFGAESAAQAISQLTSVDVHNKKWLIFGFGKVGHGLAHYCVENHVAAMVAEVSPTARGVAQALDINVFDPNNLNDLKHHMAEADIIITATGATAMFNSYPEAWFANKILAQMGITDEYGSQFSDDEVLNGKSAVNFTLQDATPIKYIDAALYAHNIAVLELLGSSLPHGVSVLSNDRDQEIIHQWTQFHGISREELDKWFVLNKGYTPFARIWSTLAAQIKSLIDKPSMAWVV